MQTSAFQPGIVIVTLAAGHTMASFALIGELEQRVGGGRGRDRAAVPLICSPERGTRTDPTIVFLPEFAQRVVSQVEISDCAGTPMLHEWAKGGAY